MSRKSVKILLSLLIAATSCGITGVAASNRLYVYPANGQSDQQLADDRFQCHRWAVAETGFDPTRAVAVPQPGPVRIAVEDNPKEGAAGKGMLAGAAAGAVIGAIDDHPGRGAAIGAIVGAIAGSEVERKGQQQVRAEAEAEARAQVSAQQDRHEAQLQNREDYRRAITACLEARGYSVR